jgi:hypothetical protein
MATASTAGDLYRGSFELLNPSLWSLHLIGDTPPRVHHRLSRTVGQLGPDTIGVSVVANLPIEFDCIETLPYEFSKPHSKSQSEQQ